MTQAHDSHIHIPSLYLLKFADKQIRSYDGQNIDSAVSDLSWFTYLMSMGFING